VTRQKAVKLLKPGDVVLHPFAGTVLARRAAQLCDPDEPGSGLTVVTYANNQGQVHTVYIGGTATLKNIWSPK